MERFLAQRSGIDAFSVNESTPSRTPKKSPQGSPGGYQDDILDDYEGSMYDPSMKLPVRNHIQRLEVSSLNNYRKHF